MHFTVFATKGLTPDVVAGLSLGNTVLWLPARLCVFQKQLWSKSAVTEAAPQGTGKMVAVMNAEREVIEKPVKKQVLSELWLQQIIIHHNKS